MQRVFFFKSGNTGQSVFLKKFNFFLFLLKINFFNILDCFDELILKNKKNIILIHFRIKKHYKN